MTKIIFLNHSRQGIRAKTRIKFVIFTGFTSAQISHPQTINKLIMKIYLNSVSNIISDKILDGWYRSTQVNRDMGLCFIVCLEYYGVGRRVYEGWGDVYRCNMFWSWFLNYKRINFLKIGYYHSIKLNLFHLKIIP